MQKIFDNNKVKTLALKAASALFPGVATAAKLTSSVSKLPQVEKYRYKAETKLNALPGQAYKTWQSQPTNRLGSQLVRRTGAVGQAIAGFSSPMVPEKYRLANIPRPTTTPQKVARGVGTVAGNIVPYLAGAKAIEAPLAARLPAKILGSAKAGKASKFATGAAASTPIVSPFMQEGGVVDRIKSIPKNTAMDVATAGLLVGGLKGVGKGIEASGLGKKIPEGLEALMKEARKYKSAEEFVRAQTNVSKPIQPTFTNATLPAENIKALGTKGSYDPTSYEYSLNQLKSGKSLEPIEVRLENGKYQITDGEHRFKAYKELGIKEIPVKIEGEPLTKSQLTDIYNQATKGLDEGVKQVEDLVPKLANKAGKFDATKEFEKIMKEPAEKLSKQEVNTILTEQVLRESSKSKFKTDLDRIFAPLKNTPKEFQDAIGDWRKAVLTGKAKANELVKEFVNIPEKSGLDFIKYTENPTKENAIKLGMDSKDLKKTATKLRKTYDSLRNEGISKGLETGYIENYLNHVWKESMPEIQAKFNSAMGSAQFMKERVIPTYEEGLRLGLTPRFTHPGQLVAHYQTQLEKAVANKAFTDKLSSLGILLKPGQAPLDWRPIKAPLFPGNYKAPPEMARVLDNVFDYQSGGLMEAAAKLSKAMQDITLSGGIPKTPINAFSLANTIKEVMAGRIKSPVSAFVRSLSDKATKNYFQKTARYSKMMAEEGIPNYSAFDYNSFYKNLTDSKTLKSVLGNAWYKGMNEPTFRRFLPQLQVNFFKDTYDSAIKSGMATNEARRVAGDATKNFYGVVDTFTRSKSTEDTLSAIFMAPKFRETMVNFWGNTVRAFKPKNLTDAAYTANRKFVAGAAITLALYDALNYKLNERHMWDNKGGKELYLEIPRENGRSWFIPFLPSISTVPRRGVETVGALLKGDTRTAAQRVTSMASMPINLGGQLLTNRTYYGAPIYDKDDKPLQKVGKLAGYSFEQTAPPIIGQPMAALQGRKTNLEAGLSMLELPVYPSKSTEVKQQNYSGNKSAGGGTLKEWLGGKAYASDGEDTRLPTTKKELSILYKDSLSTINNYGSNKTKALYGQTSTKLETYQQDVDEALRMKRLIEKKYPEKVFEIQLETYGSDSSAKVPERAKWANEKLTEIANSTPDKFKYAIMLMYKQGVLTDSVVDEIEATYGKALPYRNDVGVKTYSGKSRKKSSAKGKKLSTIFNQVQSASKIPTSSRKQPYSIYDLMR